MKKVVSIVIALLTICTIASATTRLLYLYVQNQSVSANSSWTSSWVEYQLGGVPELSISVERASEPVTIQLLGSYRGGSDDGTLVMEFETADTDWAYTDEVSYNYFAVRIINENDTASIVSLRLYE